jgi:hypothetical protein
MDRIAVKFLSNHDSPEGLQLSIATQAGGRLWKNQRKPCSWLN